MKYKMRKSLSKRIRITKRGKILRRQMGISHFRSKKSGNARRGKKTLLPLNHPL